MKQFVTIGIILTRTNYGEADRILTVLTPDHGKLRLMAKGVRRVKSKLAGGIELFSVSHITFIRGRGDIGTLVSTRLQQHYGHIVSDIRRVELGYELIKLLNKITEDEVGGEYFELLGAAFQALDDLTVSDDLIRTWFSAQLLCLGGHTPNLQSDVAGAKLDADSACNFSFDDMAFAPHDHGKFTADHIKFLRLLFSGNQPSVLAKIQRADQLCVDVAPLVRTITQTHLHTGA